MSSTGEDCDLIRTCKTFWFISAIGETGLAPIGSLDGLRASIPFYPATP